MKSLGIFEDSKIAKLPDSYSGQSKAAGKENTNETWGLVSIILSPPLLPIRYDLLIELAGEHEGNKYFRLLISLDSREALQRNANAEQNL